MIWSVIVPAVFFVLSLSMMNICDKRFKKKKEKNNTLKMLIFSACLTGGAMLLLSAIAISNMPNGKSGISPIAATLTCTAVLGSVLVKRYDAPKLARFLKGCAVCACVLFAAEVLLFNGKSFTKQALDQTVSSADITPGANAADNGDGSYTITGDSYLQLSNLPQETRVISVKLSTDKNSNPFDLTLGLTDGDFTINPVTVQHKYTRGQDCEIMMSFKPFGDIRNVNINILHSSLPVTVKDIRALSAAPYHFSLLRFTVLLAIAALLLAIKCFKLYEIGYDSKKRSHIIAVAVMTALCAMSAFMFRYPDAKARDYTGAEKFMDDPYAMTLDAFVKDLNYLDIQPDEKLLQMEDPYSIDDRNALGVSYQWDYAFYNGHYYTYFGVGPVIAFYYPYYKLTGKFPHMASANNFFAFFGILFMCLSMLALIKLLKIKKPNLVLLLSLLPASTAAMGFWNLANEIDRYTLPSVSGLCFLMLCLFTGMTAVTTEKKWLKPLLLVIGGSALAFSVSCRPTTAFGAAVLVPFFVGILLDKKQKLTFRLAQAASFVVPLIIGAALIMRYNSARFGSAFEFGTAYQLTVNNIKADRLDLTKFPAAIMHFFLQLPQFKNAFPFFASTTNPMENYGSYSYTAIGIGALVLPLVTIGLFFLPEAYGPKTKELTDRRRRQFLTICLVMPVVLAWLEFCLSGYITHYVFDLTPLLTFAAMIGIFRSCTAPASQKRRYILSGVSMALTMVFTLCIALNWFTGSLARHFPQLLEKAEDLMIFWR